MRTTRHARPLLERLCALALALAFVLHSAALAGDGCLSRAFSGRCCCAAIDSGSAPRPAAARPMKQHSCCAPAAERRELPGPQFDPAESCRCGLAPLPSAPAAPAERNPGLERSAGEDGFAHWIAAAAPVVAGAGCAAPIPPPDPGPPPRACSFAIHRRVAQRGILGLLSDLCTFRS